MKETPTQTEIEVNHQMYLKLTSIMFTDLLQLAKHEPSIFEELYYNRKDECGKFDIYMENICDSGDNILVTGEAGVGKTNFIHKLASNELLITKHNIYPLVIDYRELLPRRTDTCLQDFVEKMEKYFYESGAPINTLTENAAENIESNLKLIDRHLENLVRKDLPRHLVIFLDDLDYAEDDWHQILNCLFPLAGSPLTSFVLTTRPLLLASIDGYDNRMSYYFTRDVRQIQLQPLQVANIISSRLVPIFRENENDDIISFFKSVFSKKVTWKRLLKKLGVTNIEELEKMDYPFTVKHNNFMRLVTNGNIREIFDLAYESLVYIFDHPQLETRKEPTGQIGKVIGREGVINFACKKENSKFKLLNIHQYQSKSKNSLLFNTLEAIQIYRQIHDEFYETMQSFGHNKKQTSWAIDYLSDKANRLIQPTKFYPSAIRKKMQLYPEYVLTDKGEYFFQITKWAQYIELYGDCGRSVKQKIAPDAR